MIGPGVFLLGLGPSTVSTIARAGTPAAQFQTNTKTQVLICFVEQLNYNHHKFEQSICKTIKYQISS